MLFLAASVLLGNTDNKLSANDFVDDNISAIVSESNNPLCRGQLFKNCKSDNLKTCTFQIIQVIHAVSVII